MLTLRESAGVISTTWLVSGTGLPTLEIVANSFDDAVAQARKIDARYNTGQVKEV